MCLDLTPLLESLCRVIQRVHRWLRPKTHATPIEDVWSNVMCNLFVANSLTTAFWALMRFRASGEFSRAILEAALATVLGTLTFGPFPLTTMGCNWTIFSFCVFQLHSGLEFGGSVLLTVIMGYSLCYLQGMQGGTMLLVYSVAAPLGLKHAAWRVIKASNRILWYCLRTMPTPILHTAGIVGVIITEGSLAFSISWLLGQTAALKLNGFDFYPTFSSRYKHITKVIVLIHGNRFNECQYLWGKNLLEARQIHSQQLRESTAIIPLNLFGGTNMRDHTRETSCLRGCVKEACKQIISNLEKLGIDDNRATNDVEFILVGHSLGGIIAAYIAEFSAVSYMWRISKVITISAPFHGSFALDLIGHKPSPNKPELFDDLCPGASVLKELRESMKEHPELYFAYTGFCDSLVRPESAEPSFLRPHQKLLYPHLGHYNIKMSGLLWESIINIIDTSDNHYE